MNTENEKVVNDLLVDLFNNILTIEHHALKKEIKYDISITEIHVLEAIEKEPMPIMSNVARRLLVTVGTLTTSVKRLVEKGFVLREVDIADRRRVYLRLTPNGQDVCRLHEKFHADMVKEIREHTDFLEDKTLIDSLEKVTVFFRKMQQTHLNELDK